jgi:hypothetical protein
MDESDERSVVVVVVCKVRLDVGGKGALDGI